MNDRCKREKEREPTCKKYKLNSLYCLKNLISWQNRLQVCGDLNKLKLFTN